MYWALLLERNRQAVCDQAPFHMLITVDVFPAERQQRECVPEMRGYERVGVFACASWQVCAGKQVALSGNSANLNALSVITSATPCRLATDAPVVHFKITAIFFQQPARMMLRD